VAVAWIDQLLREAEKIVDETEVYFVQGNSVSAELKQKKVNLATASEDYGLGIRTIHKGRIGSSSTSGANVWLLRLPVENLRLLRSGKVFRNQQIFPAHCLLLILR
jgi:predicted Zn-dependent protease